MAKTIRQTKERSKKGPTMRRKKGGGGVGLNSKPNAAERNLETKTLWGENQKGEKTRVSLPANIRKRNVEQKKKKFTAREVRFSK